MKLEQTILIIALVAFILYTVGTCNEMNQKDFGVGIDTVSRSVTYTKKFDSTPKVIYGIAPIAYESIFVATNFPIDTVEIIRRYLTAYFFADTFRNSDLAVIIKDTLFNNRISNRELTYKLLRPDSIITNTITIEKQVFKSSLFTGIGIGFNGKSISVIPKVNYATAKGNMYEAGLIINSSPGIYAGINFRIK